MWGKSQIHNAVTLYYYNFTGGTFILESTGDDGDSDCKIKADERGK